MKQKIRIIVTARNSVWIGRCLESIASQTRQPDSVAIVDDNSNDVHWKIIDYYRCNNVGWYAEYNPRQLGQLFSRFIAVDLLACGLEDIIIPIDGDDWFYLPNSLEEFEKEFGDAWFSHGTEITYPWNEIGSAFYIKKLNWVFEGNWDSIIKEKTFRKYIWVYPLRAFRYKLWTKINYDDIKSITAGTDMAIIYPMLEMSPPEKVKFIDKIFYVYNRTNAQSLDDEYRQNQERSAKIIKNREPYPYYHEIGPKQNAIFIVSNEKFWKYTKACLNSIRRNYPSYPQILLNYSGGNHEHIDFFRSFDRLEIINLEESDSTLEFSDKDIGREIFLRFLLWSDHRFDRYETIMNLDADTIILKNLDELFKKKDFFIVNNNSKFSGVFSEEKKGDPQLANMLMEDNIVSPETGNCGVFLLPKKYRVKEHIDKIFYLLKRYKDFLAYFDQSAISLWAQMLKIPLNNEYCYNCQLSYLFDQEKVPRFDGINLLYDDPEAKFVNDIYILHYNGKKTRHYYYNEPECRKLGHYGPKLWQLLLSYF